MAFSSSRWSRKLKQGGLKSSLWRITPSLSNSWIKAILTGLYIAVFCVKWSGRASVSHSMYIISFRPSEIAAFSGMRPLVGLTSAPYLSNSLTVSALPFYKSSESTLSPSLGALMGAPCFSSRRTISIWPFSAANSRGLIRSLTLTNRTAF